MCHISHIPSSSSELPAFMFVGSMPLVQRQQIQDRKEN